MRNQSCVPSAPLSTFIDCFWQMDGYSPAHSQELALPDGSAELVIDLRDEPIRLFDSNRASLTFRRSLLCGPHSEPFVIDTSGATTVIGVHFKPGGAARFLNIPLNELSNLHVPLEQLWGYQALDLREELLDSPTAESRFRVLERYLLSRYAKAQVSNSAVRYALLQVESFPHAARISDIAEQTGLSHKSFIRLFHEEVGLTPKRFFRVIRFREALAALGQGKRPEWADLAAACGYSDQAHFIKEFRAFSGMTPTEYEPIEGRHPNHVRPS